MIAPVDLTRVKTERLPKKQLLQLFTFFMLNTDMKIEKSVNNKGLGTVDFICNSIHGAVTIHTMLKNVSGAGWSWRPEIKRIQVKGMQWDSIPAISNQEFFLLGGFTKVDDEPIFVCWNIFSYTAHKTNRSCYVSVEHLVECKEKGFIRTFDANNRIYMATQQNFRTLLETFISDCSVDQ